MKERNAKRELVSREGRVDDWDVSVFPHSFSVTEDGSRPSTPFLELHGSFTEPLHGQSRFSFSLTCGAPVIDEGDIASVGHIHQVRPRIEAAVILSSDEFHCLMALAVAGIPMALACTFQVPRHGLAEIQRVRFARHRSAD